MTTDIQAIKKVDGIENNEKNDEIIIVTLDNFFNSHVDKYFMWCCQNNYIIIISFI